MISLIRSQCGGIFCYNADDWFKLRNEWRIVGDFTGNINNLPALPTKFLPEEILLLLDKNVITVSDCKSVESSPYKRKYEQFESELYTEQQKVYKNNRKKQLISMLDKIVEAKRKHGDARTPEEILNEELEKSCSFLQENVIWPTLIVPLLPQDRNSPTPKIVLEAETTHIKYSVYKKLWESGYYVTSGQKFGGDFLVYLGDPIIYHSMFVVRCLNSPTVPLHSTEIIAFGRLCNSVKKRAVLATIKDENVSFITIYWADI